MNKPSKAPIKSPKLPPRQSQSGKEETKRTNSSNSSHRPSISIVFHHIEIYFMIYIPFWFSLYQLKPWPWEAITRVCFRSMKPRSTSKSNRISRTSRPSWHSFVHGWSTGKYRLRLLSVDVSSFAMHKPFGCDTPEKAGRPSGVRGHNQTSSLWNRQAEEPYDEVECRSECRNAMNALRSNVKKMVTSWNKLKHTHIPGSKFAVLTRHSGLLQWWDSQPCHIQKHSFVLSFEASLWRSLSSRWCKAIDRTEAVLEFGRWFPILGHVFQNLRNPSHTRATPTRNATKLGCMFLGALLITMVLGTGRLQ